MRNTNKKRVKYFTLLFIICYLLFTSCSNVLAPSLGAVPEAGTGILTLTIGGQDAERTILPATVFNDFVKFELSFIAKSSSNTSFNKTWTSGSGTIALDSGTWDLLISAYLDNGEGGYLKAAEGKLESISIPSGKTIAGNVPLYPIVAGQGTFNWDINYPVNVTSASMEITRINTPAAPYQRTFYFTGAAAAGKKSSLTLDSGQYRVIFKLSNSEEEASLSEVLHIYQGMESCFVQVFTEKHFPVTLLKHILGAWDNGLKKWDFTGAGITAEHFSFLGIKGIDTDNFAGITGWFNTLCSAMPVPNNLSGLKALADAALIRQGSDNTGFLDANKYKNQVLAENVIKALALNGTALTCNWESNDKTVNVQAGGYAVQIVFSGALLPPTEGLEFTLINGGTEYDVSRGTASATDVVIPAVYNGLPVTEIARDGFNNYQTMTSITIPVGVTSIGTYTFQYCSGLTSVTIPSSVTSIGNGAYYHCVGLTSITIPAGVTSIGDSAFFNCSGLTSIIVESGNTVYRNEGNCLIQISNNMLLLGCKNSEIPDSVTWIGGAAFGGCSGLTSITIPASVTSISNYAFYGCNGLTSITIPASVTSIGVNPFQNCSGLTSITVESGNTVCRSEGNCVIRLSNNALICGCNNSIIPAGVLSIGEYAFYDCNGLTSITIPAGVTSIGDSAFNSCRSLTSITIPASVTSIGNYAFQSCSSLTSVIISSGVTSIGVGAFQYCSGLTSVTIPSSVTSIGDGVFYNCSGLTSVTIGNSVTSIGNNAFYVCSGLTSVTIPSSVTSIGNQAFYYCTSLTKIFYGGADTTAWNWITIGSSNTDLTNATRYYYSKTHKTGNYWHYVNNEPTVWGTAPSDIELLWVPGGSFQLGKEIGMVGSGDETPISTVTLSGFYMGKYQVTQAQYMAVMSVGNPGFTNPSYFTTSPEGNRDNLPVELVSWYDAIVFCNKLSLMEGLSPAYSIDGDTDPAVWVTKHGAIPTGWDALSRWDFAEIVSGSKGYRLPTEAQWEYAAKGGATPDNTTYAGSDDPNEVAWYSGKTGIPTNSRTHEVGLLKQNGLGLFDMSGNVWEWCWDWIGTYTSGENPTGASSGTVRVLRGGYWSNDANYLRSVYRNGLNPYDRHYGIGFRVSLPQ